MDEEMFMEEMSKMAAILEFPPTLKDPHVILTWYNALQDLESESFKRACGLAIKNETKFPRPAILRKYAEGNILSDKQIGIDTAKNIEYCLRNFGGKCLEDSHPSRERAVEVLGKIGLAVIKDLGGLNAISDSISNESKMPFHRTEWCERAIIKYKNNQHYGEDKPVILPQVEAKKTLALEQALNLINRGKDNG